MFWRPFIIILYLLVRFGSPLGESGERGEADQIVRTLDCSSRLYQVAERRTKVGWQTVSNIPMKIRRMIRAVKLFAAAIRVMQIPQRKMFNESHFAMGTRWRIQFSC